MSTTLRLIALGFVFFVLAGTTLQLHADPGSIEVNASTRQLLLDQHLLYLHDSDNRYDLDEVMATGLDLPWRYQGGPGDTPIRQGGIYWFRITLVNTSNQDLRLLMQTKYPAISVADLYQFDANGAATTVYADAGLEDKFNNRPIAHRNLINAVNIPANSSHTLVWRVDCEPLLQFSASLWEPMAFGEWDLSVQLIHGLLYGMLLVMTIYNLFLYFSTWEKSYLYFVAYVGSVLYLIAAQQGHIYQYIAPDEVWAKLAIYVIVYCFNVLVFTQFNISFLDLKKRAPLLARLLRAAAVLSIILSVGVMISSNIYLVFTTLSVIASVYLLALVSGIYVRKQGIVSAGHHVIAIMVLAFSLIASNMAALGLISSNEFTEHLVAIGTTLMAVFFSMALADRINQLQREVSYASRSVTYSTDEKLKAEAELAKLKQQRIQLEQISSQARRESRSKSNFLATLSHEIRTPMNGVLGMTELMKATPLTEQQTYYLNTIEHSGQALLAIINDLQDFAKIEAGKMELELSSFNLETLIDDCISTFALRAIEKNINFIADLDPTIDPVLRGDANKLQQIILNLLSNAFKFTDQGDITLVVTRTGKPAINSAELKFEVRDSGIGLTEEEKQRLFTPFQHADESTYGQYGGSGIGLAISKQLAELMDGQIGVESESGKGSCFWFTARLLIEEHPDESLIKRKSTILSGKRLLLVDPSPTSGDIIKRMLESWQMEVVLCPSAQQVHEAMESAEFDVILSEYNLHNGDALTLARELRERSDYRGPFVLMASTRQLRNQQELLELGINLLLEKPITSALLHDIIKRAVQSADDNDQRPVNGAQPALASVPEVLVVEDNQVNQMVLLGLLKQLGVQADTADNGLQALSSFDKKKYDLILMDCDMPEMDGYEACRQIRAKEQHDGRDKTIIIALSAHARSDYQLRATNSGMDGYLTKPITLSELASTLREVAPQSPDSSPQS